MTDNPFSRRESQKSLHGLINFPPERDFGRTNQPSSFNDNPKLEREFAESIKDFSKTRTRIKNKTGTAVLVGGLIVFSSVLFGYTAYHVVKHVQEYGSFWEDKGINQVYNSEKIEENK